MKRPDPNLRRCARCGREGKFRSFRYTLQGVFVCTGIDACARRQDANAKEAQRQAAEILAQLHEPKETDDDQQS